MPTRCNSISLIASVLICICPASIRLNEAQAGDAGKVRVAAIQCYSRMGDIEYNRRQLTDQITEAAKRGAVIVVLPECAVSGYMDPGRNLSWTSEDKPRDGLIPVRPVAEAVPGPSTERFAQLAKTLKIYLTVPLIEKSQGSFFNAVVLIDPKGKIVAHHRKCALWAPGDGSWATRAERAVETVDTPFGRVGLMICYEVHDLPQELAKAKVDIVLYSVGWYGPNTDTWFQKTFPTRFVVPNQFSVVVANWSAEADSNRLARPRVKLRHQPRR